MEITREEVINGNEIGGDIGIRFRISNGNLTYFHAHVKSENFGVELPKGVALAIYKTVKEMIDKGLIDSDTKTSK